MLLYLRNESLYRIDTIELIDGCYPRITYDVGTFGSDGVRSPPPTEEYSVSDLNIEPAIWGVILILDRVCVDVKRRRFSWATTSVGKILDDEGTEDPSYRTHHADDEHYEYDDNVDELFNLADHLISISHSRTKSIRESQEEQSSLIRMLYCCILPKIQMYQKDFRKVEDAIKNQMSYIKKLELDIERDSQVLDGLNKILCKQQDERLNQFEKVAMQKKCTKMFVVTIDADLKKRKNQLLEQIDTNQGIVQQIKADIQNNGETVEKKRQLEEARKLSAYLDKILQRVLIASVDTIKESLESEGFQLHDNQTVVVEYLKSKDMSEKQKTVAKCQMEKKVRATSILENLKRIKEDITNKGVASATTTTYTGARPTDVISHDIHAPEYQTLSERVSAIVNNPEHPLGAEFVKFTGYLRESCQDILEGVESSRGSSVKKKKNTPNFENGYLLIDNDGTLQGEYLTPLEKLCEEIKKHCERTAELFLEQFNSVHSDVLKCKLQLCYEENFYNEVGRDIMNIYEEAYKKSKEKMIHDLCMLSTYPINCLDLGMKDEWWLELFEKRRQATLARQRSLSNPTSNRAGVGSRLSSESSTPPESENSSTNSSPSLSSHASPKDHERTEQAPHKERKKISPGSIRRKMISFMRRKSREISEEKSSGKNSPDRSNHVSACYDDYDSYITNKMSNTLETYVPDDNCTNNNEHAYIGNGTKSDANGLNVGVDQPNLDGNQNPATISLGEDATHESQHTEEESRQSENELSKFAKYFGPSLDCLKEVFQVPSVFAKLKCLTKSLTSVTNAVQELRQQVLESIDEDTNFCVAITADDLLPLMVLIILQMDAADAAAIVVELKMMQDLIPKFLGFGCHGWALVEYDMASKVLQSLCTQFDWSSSFSPSF